MGDQLYYWKELVIFFKKEGVLILAGDGQVLSKY